VCCIKSVINYVLFAINFTSLKAFEDSNTHTHTSTRMFCVKWRRRWLISKSSFSRQCTGHIRDTRSQLTWKSHSPHTHGGTFWPTLTPAQTLYLHESCQNKPKSEVCKTAMSPFDICVASSSIIFMTHAASWHKTYTYTPHTFSTICTNKHTNVWLCSKMQNCVNLFLLKNVTHKVRLTNITLTTITKYLIYYWMDILSY